MANRRMFARTITGSGRFLRLGQLARLLYYDLGMEADDDGFVEAFPRLQVCGVTEEQLRELANKGFITILDPEDLVVHIDSWGENNLIRKDRYTPSRYLEKYPQYKQEPAPEQPNTAQEPVQEEADPQKEASSPVDQGLTQVRLGKDRLSKGSVDEVRSEELKKEKKNLNQININQERKECAHTREAGVDPSQACQIPETGKNEIPVKENPGNTPVFPELPNQFSSFDSDFKKSQDSDTEFLKKKQKSIDLLLKSDYFSKERAAPEKAHPVEKSVEFLCRSCG